jgi:hypothetical protein
MNVDANRAQTDSSADSATTSGDWVMPSVSYVDPRRRFCALCGRPIARRFWQVDARGEKRIFCDPAHAHLYETYQKSNT